MPKVSVIIPVYNSEKYLRQCLNSVINQTLKDIEIICVNDGSTDSSKEILEEYAKKDKRIIVVNQKNSYAGVARNNGIKIAKGEYIHFLDSDDWIKKNTYEYLYNKMKKNDVDVIFFRFKKISIITEKIIPYRYSLRRNNQISNIERNPHYFLYATAVPWNKFYNRNFITDNHLKFDPIIASNDRSFYIHTILTAKKIMVSKKSFLYYRINNENSLVGNVRLKKYECHFVSYESILKICEKLKPSTNIRKMIIDISIKDFLNYYHQSTGEVRKQIYEKLHKYFKTVDVSICESDAKRYIWWNEYMAIKTGNMKEVEEEFEINSVTYDDKEQPIKKKFKRAIKYVNKYGLLHTIRIILNVIVCRFER